MCQVQFALTSYASSNLLRDPRPNCFRLVAFPIKPKHYSLILQHSLDYQYSMRLWQALYETATMHDRESDGSYIVFGGDASLDALRDGHFRNKRSLFAVLCITAKVCRCSIVVLFNVQVCRHLRNYLNTSIIQLTVSSMWAELPDS